MVTMKKQPICLLNVAVLSMLMALCACSRETPAQQTNSVSQKIEVQQVKPAKLPSVSAEKKSMERPPVRKEAQSSAPAKAAAPAVKPQQAPSASVKTPTADADHAQAPVKQGATAAEASDLVKASLQMADTYDPKGRFDPFQPLFKEQDTQTNPDNKKLRKRRKPQTPLERIALSQLKLTAILRSSGGNYGLVEDATGKGYVVKKGTYIGLNSGRVTEIDKDRIVVEEEIENVMGALTLHNAELKLQKPAGEL